MKNARNSQLDRFSYIHSKILKAFNQTDETFLKTNYCDRDTLFTICLPYFQSENRFEIEKKFISLYLFQIKKFTDLLKNPDMEKFIKSLNYVSENIIYEKYCKNKILMRFGDKADNFYITLSGLVSIIVPIKITMSLDVNEYNRYMALLLLYQEFEILKLVLKENKEEFNLEIPDLKFILNYLNKNPEKKKFKKRKTKKPINRSNKRNNSSQQNTKFKKKYINNFDEDKLTEEEKLERYDINRLEYFMKFNLTLDEYNKFIGMKHNINFDEKLNEIVTPETYINRLKNFEMENIKDQNLIKRYNRMKANQEKLYEKKHEVTIYEYKEIIQLETGQTFGDVTMHGGSQKRTATIISLTESHFGCLNKEVFTLVKENSEKKRKEKIHFLCHIKLFKTISIKIMSEKYINLFVFKECGLDNYIIKKDEMNENLIVIKEGTFEISFDGKIKDIFYLINYYREIYNQNNLNEKKYKLNSNLLEKIYNLNENMTKIIFLFGMDNKNNLSTTTHKLFVVNNLAIFGLREIEKKKKEQYFSLFDIKCKSIEGEYALLNKKIFYKQLYSVDYKVIEETKSFLKYFVENTINRLINIIYSKVWNLLTKDEFKVYKIISEEYGEKNIKNEENLINDVGLDFNYIKKNNLTKIEYIINKLLNKYSENDLDYKTGNTNMFNDVGNEEKLFVKKKNVLKLDGEKYDTNKFISLISDAKNKSKINFTKLKNNFKSIINKNKIKIFNDLQIIKKLRLNFNDESPLTFINNPNKSINKNKSTNASFINYKKMNLQKNNFIEKKINIRLRKCSSSYLNNRFTKPDLFLVKNKISNLSSKKINLSSSYSNNNNKPYGPITHINLSFIKDESNNGHDSFSLLKNEGKNIIHILQKKIWSNSVKNTNNTNGSYFDSTQISKESYVNKRKLYILKNTRSAFTRNKNFVLCKAVKKMEEKMV